MRVYVCVVNVLCVVFACNIRSKIYMICVCGCLCVKRTCVQLQKRIHIYIYYVIEYVIDMCSQKKINIRYLDAINIC